MATKVTIQGLEKEVYVGRYFTPEDADGNRQLIHPETNENAVLLEDGTKLKDKLVELAGNLKTAKDYTDEKLAALVNGAPEAYDTLMEIATKLGDNDDTVAAMLETIGTKANATDVYTKEELDAIIEEVEGNIAALDYYTKAETDAKVAAVPVVVTGEAAVTEVTGLKATDIYCQYL